MSTIRDQLKNLQWLARFRARGPIWVTSLLAGALVLQAFSFVRGITAASAALKGGIAPVSGTGISHKVDTGRIIAAHLFGLVPAAAQFENQEVKGPTAAALVLTGVLAPAAGSNGGAAIIGGSKDKTRFVMVGDEVSAGIVLRQVYPDHVILERAGVLESLALPRSVGQGFSLYAASAGAKENDAAVEPPPGQDLDAIRKATDSTNDKLAQLFQATPVINGTLYTGVTVKPGYDSALFARLGFQPGDTITHVNGIPLDDPSALDVIALGKTVRLGVRRPEGIVQVEISAGSL